MTARRLSRMLPALAVAALVPLAGCGSSQSSKNVSEGVPVKLGELQYNVLFSRFLNPNDIEDREYLVGQPAAQPGQIYLGVFVQIKNEGSGSVTLPSGWTITDTEHHTYSPLPSRSPYALRFGDRVGPEDQVPALDSTAQVGPIGGSLVLFSVPTVATESRPLRLVIPGSGGPAEVQLDI